ncbi:unnamed protein product [Rhizophagus irregularis]|nr:unnamed protein product [Rhizophagus irregularis]
MARNNKKRKEINNEYEFNINIAEGSSAVARRQNTEQPPAKKAKIKQNTTKWVVKYSEEEQDDEWRSKDEHLKRKNNHKLEFPIIAQLA